MRYFIILIAITTFSLADFIRVWAGAHNNISDNGQTNTIWILGKTFLPIVPNIRIEQTSPNITNKQPATNDIIAYYNLLDNTLWATLDVGVGGSSSVNQNQYLGFARARVQIPLSSIGFEAMVKNNLLSPSELHELTIKADIDVIKFPLILDLGVEAGYKITNNVSEVQKINTPQEGYFIGIVAKF